MSNPIIRSDDDSLTALKNALDTAGESYIQNLAALTNLISDITSGSIKGDPATDLQSKFEDKQAMFNNITTTIEEAAGYAGVKITKFSTAMSNMKKMN